MDASRLMTIYAAQFLRGPRRGELICGRRVATATGIRQPHRVGLILQRRRRVFLTEEELDGAGQRLDLAANRGMVEIPKITRED